MRPRDLRRTLVAVAVVLAGCSGESKRDPAKLEVDVGAHRVRLVPPAGWEHLDHGQQHLFRFEEMQISLTDLGPPPRDAGPAAGEDSLDAMAEHAIQIATDLSRREVKQRSRRSIHGVPWIEVETWDRVTHSDPRRMACARNGANILVLSHDRGPADPAGVAYQALLGTIELLPAP